MIPKIEYQTHELLTRVFIPPFEKKSDFEKHVKKFIKHFKKIEKEILVLIEKFSGFEWTKKKIPVYLIPNGKIVSRTKSNLEKGLPGIIQKVRNNTERDTHIMIHELVHVNQFQTDFSSKENRFAFNKKGIRNYIGWEVCAEIVCLYVIRELFGKKSKYEKDYWKFLNQIQTSTPGKELEVPKYLKKWDLNKKTLRDYILKKN